MTENPYSLKVENNEGKFIIVDQKIQKMNASQASYNIPVKFFRDAFSKGILKHNSDLNLTGSGKTEKFTLFACTLDKNEFSFKLGPGILWLIGDEYNNDDNEFSVIYARTDKNEYSEENHSDWRVKPQIRSTNYEKWGRGYEWFIKLFEKNLVGNEYFFEIDDENSLITFDMKFNGINSSLSFEDVSSDYNFDEWPHNWIFFGAPGTGKSFNLNEKRLKFIKDDSNYERVTFHPDYSYANFVGTYKPVSNIDEKNKDETNLISYRFVPGPFIRVLVNSIKDKSHNPHLLIIEEINRANVAAVFGDVFQLLDRKDGCSEYPVKASEDLKKYLQFVFKEEYSNSFPNDEIVIPDNMYIWATMNSADQGVYMMDTAFKRRWDFLYFGINHSSEKISDVMLKLGKDNKQLIKWNELREAINEKLLSFNINEDKLLGPFFISPKVLPREIDRKKLENDGEKYAEDYENINKNEKFKEIFKNKVLMYLFEDVAKPKRDKLFDKGDKEYLLYSDICTRFDEEGINIFCKTIREKFKLDDEGI